MKNNMELNLNNKEWKEFLFPEIFIIKNGFYNKKPKSSGKGNIPFIGATIYENGVTEFYTEKEIADCSKMGHGKNHDIKDKIFKGNCIAVTNNGSVGYAYYQVSDFSCSHDVNPLYLKNYTLNENLSKFLIAIIEKQKVCFEYARKWITMRLVKSKILLPVNSKGKPDFEFMENYIKHKEAEKKAVFYSFINKKASKLKNIKKIEPLENKNWDGFFIDEVTTIMSGKDIYATERIKGTTPYISATANNNGIGAFVGNKNSTLEANCISVNRNGSVGYSFYHSYEALFSNDCRKLRLKKPNKYVGIFISQQITRQKAKYGYGYKMGTARLKRQKIMLPINEKNEPDFEYMENYIKNLEFKKLNEYLQFKKA
jgi:hypothetical protein